MKYKKGQKVRIISDVDDYPYCIGKTGILWQDVTSASELSVVDVRFSFPLPKDIEHNNTRSTYIRNFHLREIEPISKEETVKTLLQKLKV